MIKLLKEKDIVYFSSFLDGEGSLYIKKTKATSKQKNPQFTPVLTISNTHKPTLEFLYNIFEVGVLKAGTPPKKRNHRQVWTLIIQGNAALHVVETLLPYMITKKEEAIEFLRFKHIEKATGKHLTFEMLEERDEIYHNLQQLKRIEFVR